ncbi:MAG: hypothetical protein N2593_01400 [Patescibacteria group bacterium]|nr:hypothetical protein [Patescibacteria group bacterium]
MLANGGFAVFLILLEKELYPYNIRIIFLYPGKIKTKLFEKTRVKKDLFDAFDPFYTVKFVKFILSMPDEILIFQARIKNINQ